MKQAQLALGIGVATLAGASAANAQVTPDMMRRGPIGRQMDFSVLGEVQYDTNVTRSSLALARLRGLKRPDTLLSPSAAVNIVQPVGQQVLFLQGRASYDFHDTNTRLDHARLAVNGGAGGRLGPCSMVAGAGYSQSRSALEDGVLDANINNILEVKRVNVALSCVQPPSLQVFANASQDWGDNSATLSKESDYRNTSVSGGLSYGRPNLGTLSMLGTYARGEYPNRPTLNGETSGYEQVGAGVQFERRLGARIETLVGVNYVQVEQLAPVLGATTSPDEKFSGLTYTASLTFRASSRLRTSASFERTVQPTLVTNQSFEVQTNYDLRALYRLGTRITLEGAATQKQIDSHGDATAGVTLTDARTRRFTGRISYRQSARLSFSIRGEHERRRSDNAQFNYTADRIGFAADISL